MGTGGNGGAAEIAGCTHRGKRCEAVGEIDGKLGAGTRASVKAAQMKLGLPADSYPTQELVERLRGGR